MKKIIKDEIIEDIEELEKLLTDRIVEYHKVKGGQSARHSFILYRERLMNIKYKINEVK